MSIINEGVQAMPTSRAMLGGCGNPKVTKPEGALSIQIRELNDQISYIDKIIDKINNLVFVPLPECCEGSNIPPETQFKTVNRELDLMHSRLLKSKSKLDNVLDGLESQLDDTLRLA
jgi:hypothetical protein